MSDTESEYSENSENSENSEYSDTVGVDAKTIMKQKFISYKCIDCEMLKFPIKQGFIDGVSNSIVNI